MSETLSAQRIEVKRELDDLASPAAYERAAAKLRIANLDGDIAADLRLAYQITSVHGKRGLIQAAELRGDTALVQQAAAALGNEDERLSGAAHDYLMSLPFGELAPDVEALNESQLEAWREFHDFRIRRDLASALIDAHLKPGKYFGQFDELRKFDTARIDAELMRLVEADQVFADPLNRASLEAIESDGPPERAFQNTFRTLRTAAGGFSPAMKYVRELNDSDELQDEIKRTPRSRYLSAVGVFGSLRAAAVRALAGSPDATDLTRELAEQYRALEGLRPAPEMEHLVDLDGTRVEIEVALARFGHDSLLQARIATLRSRIDRVQEANANVNMNVNARPDLVAQNEIAHLMLRSGDLAGAEAEWADAADTAVTMLRDTRGRNRTSLSSYMAAVYYNLACAQSLQLKSSQSLASLKRAVQHGYKDFIWMLEDGDLYEVRHSAEFAAWFDDVAPPSVSDRLRSAG